jgi:hypothetical protein
LPRDGYITLPIYTHSQHAGAEILMESSKYFAVRLVPFTTSVLKSRVDLAQGGLTTIWPADMKRLKGDGFTVYYDKDCEADAKQMLESMATLRQTIRNVLGLEPTPFGVAIVKETANYFTPDWPLGVPVFSFPRDFDLKIERHPIVTVAHEWTENTLGAQLVGDDRKLRFAFDGLAELVQEINSGQLFCKSLKFLESLERADVKCVNLLMVFLSPDGNVEIIPDGKPTIEQTKLFPAGYPLSHLFWRRVVDQHGLSVIKEIVRQWRIQGQLSADDLIDLVAKVTGDTSVRHAIEHANIQDAIREYQQRQWVSKTLDDHIYMHVAPEYND